MTTGFSREMLDAYDAGEFDAVVVRQEGSRRGGEKLTEDGSAGSPQTLCLAPGEALPLATLAPPCGVRAIAVRALDKAGIAWSEGFVGGGVMAVAAAALAGPCGRAAGPANRAGGTGRYRPGAKAAAARGLKGDAASKVSDPRNWRRCERLAATFRSAVAADNGSCWSHNRAAGTKWSKSSRPRNKTAPRTFLPIGAWMFEKDRHNRGICSKANGISGFWSRASPTMRSTCSTQPAW